ncbi:hypothetical protein A5819_000783 [Enterococcus sp. 7E2_DIV0204]|uniref:hypothetical protein n=2 Tax=unclassified Enterococcus TaxID=2608891 RepID=UPI000A3569BA|nr:hypothetical protein [Enterococcus sp. 7E2_DIV0204]OTN88330.1 hypothetical protein A5819_000782 [Enterococcus sp. 7E2_DIV0204]OTN88331.1 hypothetical protein A5819_000783 [Enterococcus sp. 7E2_DIV0204]
MNRKKKLDNLMTLFGDEKKFIIDGYYRLRTIDDDTIELAYLVAGPCGDSIAHPKIIVSLIKSAPIGTKFIDMHSSPPLLLTRNDDNTAEIDRALDTLIQKFESSLCKQKNTKMN